MSIEDEKELAIEENLKQRVYHLMNGSWNIEEYPIVESKFVENEFAEGLFCCKAYREIFNANRRLCIHLGVEENRDVEIIISNSLNMTEYLCMKMFDYGELFSQNNEVDENWSKLSTSYNYLSESDKKAFIEFANIMMKHFESK